MANKLVQFVNSLDLKEKNFLSEYLQTKNSKKNDSEFRLFTLISTLNEDLLHDDLMLFVKIFETEDYNDQKWRLFTSSLLKTLEEGICELISRNEELENQLRLLKFYRSKSLDKHFNGVLRRIQLRLEKETLAHSEYNTIRTKIETELSEMAQNAKRSQDPNIQNVLDSLDLEYASKKLRYMCLSAAHGNVFEINHDFGIGEDLLRRLRDGNFQNHPSIEVYFRCYDMLSDMGTESKFLEYTKVLRQFSDRFPEDELKGLYLLAINYCIRLLNQGNTEYGKIGLELYKEALDKHILLTNGRLSRYTYRNIATMALRVGEFDWAEEFSEEFKKYINKRDIENAYHFNMALIHYNRHELEDALDALIKVHFKDALITMAAKSLQMKIYYEKEEMIVLDSHLEAMKMFLLRNRVIGYHKQNYLNIIKYTRKLIRLKKYDEVKRVKLLQEIEQTSPLTEKKWLMSQVS